MSTEPISLSLTALDQPASTIAICSLPLPPSATRVQVRDAVAVQVTPLGQWPARELAGARLRTAWRDWPLVAQGFDNPPRRGLLMARFADAAPDTLDVTLSPGQMPVVSADQVDATCLPVPGPEEYHHRDEALYHYVRREDAVALHAFGQQFKLSLAFDLGHAVRRWQWVQVQELWAGPVARAYLLGGHIYGGAEDRPLTMEESRHYEQTPFHDEHIISARAYVICYANGAVTLQVHFANVQVYGMGAPVTGLPLVEVHGSTRLEVSRWTVAEGATQLSADGCVWQWRPLADPRIWLGHRPSPDTGQLRHEYVEGSATQFVRGVARSSAATLNLLPDAAAPRRCLAPANWYLRCGEFGQPLPERQARGYDTLQQISEAAVEVFLRNVHREGMSRGGIYRYLDEQQSRHELSMDGNEVTFLLRGAYLRTHGPLYHAALEAARHIADIAVDHESFDVHYHADFPTWRVFSQIYLRFGGLVNAYAETGDPWYLDNAQAVAERWISLNRLNQPRQNMGRDAEPVEGILLLYDLTGQEHYYQAAQQIAVDVARSLFADGSWRCGCGVGPFWGVNALQGSPWNGSHLLAGIAEFLIRAQPEQCQEYAWLLGRATDLVRELLRKVRAECQGFHRATGAFLPRRHYLIAHLAQDEELLKQLLAAVTMIEQTYRADPARFFQTGHHCAGYLDSPAVLLALQPDRPTSSG